MRVISLVDENALHMEEEYIQTPDINTAAAGQYAREFNHEGARYKVVFQNRVNPIGLERYKNVINENILFTPKFQVNLLRY